MKQKEIKVLMIEPGKHPRVTVLQDDLAYLQKAVSIGVFYLNPPCSWENHL